MLTLWEGFFGMKASSSTPERFVPVVESVHNTSVPTTKVALVQESLYDEAVTQFSAIHGILLSNIAAGYHGNVFTLSRPMINNSHIDSVSSYNSSCYASHVLARYNPQGGDDLDIPLPSKHYHYTPLTYAAATRKQEPPWSLIDTTPTTLTATVSTLKTSDIDTLHEKLKVASTLCLQGMTMTGIHDSNRASWILKKLRLMLIRLSVQYTKIWERLKLG
jgi:hypothetical protein